MKRCIECSQPIDNDFQGEDCPGCGAPLVPEEIVEEFYEEDGVVGDIMDEDDEFDPEEIEEDDDEDDEDDDPWSDGDESDEGYDEDLDDD